MFTDNDNFAANKSAMKPSSKPLALITLMILLLQTTLSAQNAAAGHRAYVESVEAERAAKDAEFSNPDETPLRNDNMMHFKGLNYFRISDKYRIVARLEIYDHPDTIRMKTTTERLPLYLIYGKASFSLKNRNFSLTIYRNVGLMSKEGYEDYLFVPFRDETSGKQSYAGGRYVDARISGDSTIVIDFNKAYNPYCVYNSKKYSCPVPPDENYLPVTVKAGEKDFAH